MLDTKAYKYFVLVLFVCFFVLVADSPGNIIIYIPLCLVMFFLCLGILWLFLRNDLNNFWWYQLASFLLFWPALHDNLPHVGNPSNEGLTHLSFTALALAHIGAAAYWYFGIRGNTQEFPTVAEELPADAFALTPLVTWLCVGAISTSPWLSA